MHAHYYPCSVYQALFFTRPSSVHRVHEKYSAGDEASAPYVRYEAEPLYIFHLLLEFILDMTISYYFVYNIFHAFTVVDLLIVMVNAATCSEREELIFDL